jgi:small multidrug resistance pump
MGYVLLVGAIAAEVGATTAMKYSDGFSRLWPSVLTGLGYAVAFVLLAQTLKTVSVGTAYAIWTGIGTVGTVLLGIWLLGDAASASRLICIALIVAGIAGLKLTA